MRYILVVKMVWFITVKNLVDYIYCVICQKPRVQREANVLISQSYLLPKFVVKLLLSWNECLIASAYFRIKFTACIYTIYKRNILKITSRRKKIKAILITLHIIIIKLFNFKNVIWFINVIEWMYGLIHASVCHAKEKWKHEKCLEENADKIFEMSKH